MTGPPLRAAATRAGDPAPEDAGPEPERTDAMSGRSPAGLIALLVAAAAVVAITGARAFSGVLGPVFLALMFAIAAQPSRTGSGAAAVPLVG